MKSLCSFAATLLLTSLAACSVKPNVNDPSKPDVEIKVRDANNQYVPMSNLVLPASNSNPFDIMCTVNDPGGVSFISLTFTPESGSCTKDGTVTLGSFVVPTPADQSETVQPDAQGKVPTNQFFLGTVQGPFTCLTPQGPGFQTGAKITAVCTGKNWANKASNKTATAKLTIKVQ